ncbi:MAG: hypothetical protein HC900_12515 [Methylacidiphilales bacterium]|nr:hypothetical protein [Candidatus Methylacidiphilales bacterium]
MTETQLHRRAFVFGAVTLGAAAVTFGTGSAEAAPASPVPPGTPEGASAFDALFRPDRDTVKAETVQWRTRCYRDRWGRRVCVRQRWVCWWHRGRRVCGWR